MCYILLHNVFTWTGDYTAGYVLSKILTCRLLTEGPPFLNIATLSTGYAHTNKHSTGKINKFKSCHYADLSDLTIHTAY